MFINNVQYVLMSKIVRTKSRGLKNVRVFSKIIVIIISGNLFFLIMFSVTQTKTKIFILTSSEKLRGLKRTFLFLKINSTIT